MAFQMTADEEQNSHHDPKPNHHIEAVEPNAQGAPVCGMGMKRECKYPEQGSITLREEWLVWSCCAGGWTFFTV